MIIKKLALINFRNFKKLETEFEEKVNIITGNNGAGKTNLVEAIYYLSLARSFREVNNIDLINKGNKNAIIRASVSRDDILTDVAILITPTAHKILVNGKVVRKLSSLLKLVNVVVFEPKDSFIFRGSPSIRRNFLDLTLVKKYPEYLEILSGYDKLLKERNQLLKNEEVDLLALDVITDKMSEYALKIILYRHKLCSEINEIISKVVNHIKGVNDSLEVVYQPFIDTIDLSKDKIVECFRKNTASDIKKKVTSIGVQREDFQMLLNGKDVATTGSQGENRLAAIALKLVPYFLIKEKEDRPIVIMDDVMSELDAIHQKRLFEFLQKLGQVFVTETKINQPNTTIYHIENNQLLRRKA